MNLKEFQRLLLIHVLTVYLLCLAFDIVVSYSVYSTHNEYFFTMEKSQEFIDMIRVGRIPMSLITQSILLVSIPIALYWMEMRFSRDIFNYLLIIAITITLCGAVGHLMGGMSWWHL